MSNKNILIIIGVVVVLILGILIWNLNLKIKTLSRPPATSQPAVPATINTSTEPAEIQFKPISTQTTSPELSVTSTPRVFCNYRFKIKGCVKNKSQIDIDREKEGKEIIKKTEYVHASFSSEDLSDVDLIVSDKRYQMFRFRGDEVLGPTVVVDLFKKEITDSFWEQHIVKVYPDRIVFVFMADNALAQYKFGTEKHTIIPDSELEPHLIYCSYRARYVICGINVISSTTNTITLGVYDERKIIRDDEGFRIGYKKVGTKTIKLPD
jgi:hypothetical protein